MVEAMVVSLLYKHGITYSSIEIDLPNIEIINPSSDPSAYVTADAILSEYALWKQAIDEQNAAAQEENDQRQAELLTSMFKNIKLSEIDAYIAEISTMAEVREAFRKLARFVIAKLS
jgi:hypothetical protein